MIHESYWLILICKHTQASKWTVFNLISSVVHDIELHTYVTYWHSEMTSIIESYQHCCKKILNYHCPLWHAVSSPMPGQGNPMPIPPMMDWFHWHIDPNTTINKRTNGLGCWSRHVTRLTCQVVAHHRRSWSGLHLREPQLDPLPHPQRVLIP